MTKDIERPGELPMNGTGQAVSTVPVGISDAWLSIAERVESLSYPDREVDALIACLIGKPLGNVSHWLHGPDISYKPTAYGYYVAIIPTENDGTRFSEPFTSKKFTESIDAAVTLVPEGAQWQVDSHYNIATVHRYWSQSHAEDMGYQRFSGEGASAALALTAAALRARASL